MPISLPKNTKAVGYTRLSTNLQPNENAERQAALIRDECVSLGWDLLNIFDEVASAVSRTNAAPRLGLRDAFALAQRESAIVIVTEPTRLFRNKTDGLAAIRAHDVKVYSIKDRRILTRKMLGAAFQAGDAFARAVQIGSSISASGRNMPTKHLKSAAASSRRARALKSEEVAEAIADAFELDPALEALTHKSLAEALNSRGILSGWNRPWNASSVRDRRKRATEILRVRREVDAEEDVYSSMLPEVPISHSPSDCAAISPVSTVMHAPPESAAPVKMKFNDHRDSPFFGLF